MLLSKLEHHKILILGDVMLDRYLAGQVTRISPEAPVPVVHFKSSEDRLGGAANVALNIKALDSTPILCSVCGNDDDGRIFSNILPQNGISAEGIVFSSARTTTVKTRVIGNNQQMLRIDKEDTFDLTADETTEMLARVKSLLKKHRIGAIILQDYNKGVLTGSFIESVLAESRKAGIPVAVDPKKNNFFAYRGVALFKPNLKEIRDSAPFSVLPTPESLQKASDFLRQHLHNDWTMITLSEKGLFMDANGESQIYPTIPRNVADVSGAGDTVISIAALGLAAGISPRDISILSNLAGGQVCETPGVVPVNKALLGKELEEFG